MHQSNPRLQLAMRRATKYKKAPDCCLKKRKSKQASLKSNTVMFQNLITFRKPNFPDMKSTRESNSHTICLFLDQAEDHFLSTVKRHRKYLSVKFLERFQITRKISRTLGFKSPTP